MDKVTVLIDADPIVYRVGFSLEGRSYYLTWHDVQANGKDVEHIAHFHNAAARDAFILFRNLDPDEHASVMVPVPEGDERIVFGRVKTTLRDIEHNVGAYLYEYGQEIGDVRVFLSGSTNFRNQMATIVQYKVSRLKAAKPYWYQQIRDYLIRRGAEVSVGIEADDAVSTAQYQARPGTTIICTIDKDLRMIPGQHYNYMTKKAEFIKPGEAMRTFYRQVCMGDRTDDIPGCYMVGEKKADEIIHGMLRSERSMFKATLKCYEDNIRQFPGKHEPHKEAIDSLVENARLLWMQRASDELWNPPGEKNGSMLAWFEKHGVDPDEDWL